MRIGGTGNENESEAGAEEGEDRYTSMVWPSPNGDVSEWARPDHRPPSLYQKDPTPLRPCGDKALGL